MNYQLFKLISDISVLQSILDDLILAYQRGEVEEDLFKATILELYEEARCQILDYAKSEYNIYLN